MLIDWISARLDLSHLPADAFNTLVGDSDCIVRYSRSTKDIVWCSQAWDSVRSDSHQIAYRVTHDAFYLQGSPARVMGDGDAVFGSGASAELDLPGSLDRMIQYVNTALPLKLPRLLPLWKVTRIDVTQNLLLGSLDEVKDALRILRNCEGGRYRVSQQAGDSVYWSQRSDLRSGKAYAKGPHLVFTNRENKGLQYAPEYVSAADRLLRLELSLKHRFFRELSRSREWFSLTPAELRAHWESFFLRMIGDSEMTSDAAIYKRVHEVADTEGRARAAYGCWLMIKTEGWERARAFHSKNTWYRHLRVLRAAGLSDADISAGQVVPLRRRILDAQPVNTWEELFAA